MLSGSLRLSGVSVFSIRPPVSAIEPQTSQGFTWAVIGPDLGTHKLGDRLATTLSASFNDAKVHDYSLQAGGLPPDISLNASSGVLIGTLTATGRFVFTIRAQVDGQLSDATYSIDVD